MTDYLVEWLRSETQLTIGLGLGILLAYIVTSFVFVPRAPLLMATGAAFGWQAFPIVFVGANLGCILAFLAARHIAATPFQRMIGRSRFAHAVARAVDREGWRIVALVRLAGPVPAGLASYAFGLSRISLGCYALCTAVFATPAIAVYLYLGSAGRSVLSGADASVAQIALVPVAIVVCLVLWLVGRATRLELAAPLPKP